MIIWVATINKDQMDSHWKQSNPKSSEATYQKHDTEVTAAASVLKTVAAAGNYIKQ